MKTTKMRFILPIITTILGTIPGFEKKPTERKNYFKRDEFEQSSMFRLPQHMTFQELKKEKNRHVKAGNNILALNYMGFLIKKCTDPTELEQLRLEFADMLYAVKHCDEAATEYALYAQLYPGSEHAAYADFQAIKALKCGMLSADRDQDRTQEIINAAKKFVKKAEKRTDYAVYLKDVEAIAHECSHQLCESEMLHFYFNLNHNQLKAAAARLEWIKENFCACTTCAQVLELEYRFARAAGDEKTAQAKLQELARKYPTYKVAVGKERDYAAWF